MSLSTGPITARAPERRLQELLNEWLALYFNGQPHPSPLGDVTFADCDRLFNQADIPSPQDKPQIHTVFTGWRATEEWWIGGELGTWGAVLATPASGVRYGATTDGFVEESVHGAPARRISGSNIRWRDDAGTFVEEVLADVWTVTRSFPTGTTALRWQRSGLLGRDYAEQANIAGTWTTLRVITPSQEVWDGTKVLVTVRAELSQFIRVPVVGGDLNKTEFTARTLAAGLDELYRDDDSRALLVDKGFRSLTHRSGPSPLPTSGYATRLLVYLAEARYFLPKEGQ